MNAESASRQAVRQKWIDRLDIGIEAGILLFVFLYPVKTVFGVQGGLPILKALALYLPLIFWIAKMIFQKQIGWVRTPIDRPLLLYTLLIVASVGYSVNWYESVAGLRGSYAKYLALYLVILHNFNTLPKLKRLSWALASSFFVTICAGLFDYALGQTSAIGGLTAFGNRHHNVIGLILGGLFPFSFIPFIYGRRPLEKGGAVFLIIVGFLAIFLTLSRGTWVGVTVAFLLWGAYRNWRLIAAGVMVLVTSVFLLGPDSIAERAGQLEREIGTANGRTPIWEVAFGQIKERPLLGYGYGPGIFTPVYEEGRTHQPGEESNVPHEHNLFISLLIQNGIIGLILYLWFFGGLIACVFWLIGRIDRGIERDLLVMIISGLIGEYLIHAMFERNNLGNWAIPFWAMAGMAMAILNRHRAGQKGASIPSA